ncbi:MAG: DegT/DnrJ/EryC1/StrS family aminotransferase, partial [Actinomycetota bacterium]|nr:DegT/DnrJ/EryC1/StrS family aminotransferase [Actinomycetota bacterium]
MLPYGRQSISDADVAAVTAVLGTDRLTTGPAVSRFEEDLAAVTGHACVAVTSGTAALHVAYAAAGVGPGQDVVVSPLTFVATAA